jgi:signal transduction histidine kinase
VSRDELTVLVIEDEAAQVALLAKMFESTEFPKFRLVHRDSLEGGLERVLEGGIDVILLDLGLAPESEGIDTFYRVYAGAPDTAIIVLSGEDDEALAIETVQRGAQDYLVKGHVDRHWLVRAIRYGIERKRAQRELRRAHDDLEARVAERTIELREINTLLKEEISERKRVEGALRASNAQLEEAVGQLRETQENVIQRERLHALGRMASGIAHDFNNALAPILGYSELLLKRPDLLSDVPKLKGYIEKIHEAAAESAKVVSRLREFYRYRDEAEVFGPVVIEDLVNEVILLTQPRWKDQAMGGGVDIQVLTDLEEVPSVSGNEAELREMLTNLVFNAIESIRKSGAITISTRRVADSVVLEVRDTGVGMSEEVRKRCLEPFFSTKDVGTGLGLGIVYGVVSRHGGTVEIESEEGRGTTVRVTLHSRREQRMPEQIKEVEAPQDSLRILVVEDEPLVREVITVYLDEDGHRVETAENGVEGLKRFEAGEFDIVLTDRAMPEMNGDQLAIAIKERQPTMPVVLLTGFGDLMEGGGERPSGVDVIVSKPFTFDTLRDAIRKGLQGAG